MSLGRLLYLNGIHLDAGDGDTEHTWEVARGLERAGWEVTLLGPAHSPLREATNRNFRLVCVRSGYVSMPILLAYHARRLIRTRRFDMAFVRPSLKLSLAVEMLRHAAFPYLIEVHTDTLGEYRAMKTTSMRTAISMWAEKREFSGAQGAICMTEELCRYARRLLPKGASTGITGNGFQSGKAPLATFDRNARDEIGVSPDAMVLVFLGSLQPWQGVDYVIEALAQLPWTWLWVIGSGSEEGKLRELAKRLDVQDRVKWFGWVTGDRLDSLLKAADVGIGTLALSRKKMQEAQPLKVRRYLGSGLPTIIGYRDTLIGDGFPGVWHAKDALELCACIEALRKQGILRDNQFRRQVRNAAFDLFSWDTIARRTSDILTNELQAWMKGGAN